MNLDGEDSVKEKKSHGYLAVTGMLWNWRTDIYLDSVNVQAELSTKYYLFLVDTGRLSDLSSFGENGEICLPFKY